ncbi:DUF1566 domain-containing protein [Candidatus Kuenenia sp.]|uniref:Lcl C-terminal domain-containing protein n=1 Tax=Candidatus Kuenenia sp. TaxID=2499824 RepID=UPI00321FD0F8
MNFVCLQSGDELLCLGGYESFRLKRTYRNTNGEDMKKGHALYPGSLALLKILVLIAIVPANSIVFAAMETDAVVPTGSVVTAIFFRNTPENGLSPEKIQSVLKKKGLFDSRRNPLGKGITHAYEIQKAGKVVHDRTVHIAWQQSGSQKEMNYAEAKHYISQLNRDQFAGYNDWRLPTTEEAMSLMQSVKKKTGLNIDELFDPHQERIWTSDIRKEGTAWVVRFDSGYCDYTYTDANIKYHVRAVR